LSEAWSAGLPVVVPPIGALVDRVSATGAGWVLTEDEWQSDERMLERIANVLDPMKKDEYQLVAARARTAPRPALKSMTDATLAVYREAMGRAASAAPTTWISAARCLAALHYQPWRPPVEPAPQEDILKRPDQHGAIAGIARVALRIRHTLPGRMLYRLAPKALLEALKARVSG
jgi:hypothetical protein